MARRGIRLACTVRVFAFDSINEALAYVEAGRARDKVVAQVRPPEARSAV